MYLSFVDYQAKGGVLEQPEFTRAEFMARKKINELTFNRIQEVTENIRMCVFELVEGGYMLAINDQNKLDAKKVSSMSAGKTSVSYENQEGKAEEIIRSYLSDSPNLFYAGI